MSVLDFITHFNYSFFITSSKNTIKEMAAKSDAAAKMVAEADDELGSVAGGAGSDPENGDCGGMFEVCRAGFMLLDKDRNIGLAATVNLRF